MNVKNMFLNKTALLGLMAEGDNKRTRAHRNTCMRIINNMLISDYEHMYIYIMYMMIIECMRAPDLPVVIPVESWRPTMTRNVSVDFSPFPITHTHTHTNTNNNLIPKTTFQVASRQQECSVYRARVDFTRVFYIQRYCNNAHHRAYGFTSLDTW
jgi:hypothetical protein